MGALVLADRGQISMGEFFWPIGVWSADGERMETVEALVHTGAS